MGIVLKRRDNADILKYVYGGVIDTIINKLDVNKSIEFLQISINKILNSKFDIGKFVITKSLQVVIKIRKELHIKFWQIEWENAIREINPNQMIEFLMYLLKHPIKLL